MLSRRRFPAYLLLAFAVPTVLKSMVWAALVFVLYHQLDWQWLRVPFLPIATVGTAVAFYVGFKNNSSYDRFWEGRKIWGGIVNASRTWANFVVNHVHAGHDDEAAHAVHRELLYRQLAWINALRVQLRKKSRFFDKPARATKKRLDNHAEHMRNDWDKELSPFLSGDELASTAHHKNAATHLLVTQGKQLSALQRAGAIDLFHQIQLMNVVQELYALQGKCERIKNTPFPRQYAEYSRLFTRVFVVLVPFGMLDVFGDHVKAATTRAEGWMLVIPMILACALVSWVFVTMEGIGDASEDPFERSMNDVPMNALCRAIEIDLRQILGETDLPEPEASADGVLY